MDDAAGLSLNMAWPALQNMYEEGVSHAKALRRSLVQQLRGNESFWRTLKLRDEVLAHIRWSSRILQGDMRVPVPVEWDSRHVVALLEFARVINAHLTHHHQLQLAQAAHHPHSSSSSSSSNQCTDSSTSFGPALPPVALALVAANLIIFFKPGGVLLRDVSLSPYCVLDRKQWYRLATAAFVHVDATHLITNLTAALPEVLLLEEVQGSGPLLADLALLTLLSHLLYVGSAVLMKNYTLRRSTYYQVVTVGCSGVVFALKVWAGCKRGGHVYVWGLKVPSQFAWVPALALTHLCVPEASFPAHLCGVLAGVVRAYLVEPVVQLSAAAGRGVHHLTSRLFRRRPQQAAGQGGQHMDQQRLYVLGSQPDLQLPEWRQQRQQQWRQQRESEGGSPVAGSPHRAAQGGQHRPAAGAGACSISSSSSGSRSGWRDLGIHVGLVLVAGGIYWVASKGSSSSSSRGSTWSRSSMLSWRR